MVMTLVSQSIGEMGARAQHLVAEAVKEYLWTNRLKFVILVRDIDMIFDRIISTKFQS